LAAYAILLFLAAQAFRNSNDWRSLIWFLMIFGFLVAVFGILQQVTFNGKLYWFREMRLRRASLLARTSTAITSPDSLS